MRGQQHSRLGGEQSGAEHSQAQHTYQSSTRVEVITDAGPRLPRTDEVTGLPSEIKTCSISGGGQLSPAGTASSISSNTGSLSGGEVRS